MLKNSSFSDVGTSNPTKSKTSNKMAKQRKGCKDHQWMMSMGRNDMAQALNSSQIQRKQCDKSHRSVGNSKTRHAFAHDTKKTEVSLESRNVTLYQDLSLGLGQFAFCCWNDVVLFHIISEESCDITQRVFQKQCILKYA